MKFESVLLGDICEIGDGAHSKITRQKSGIMYLTSKNIKYGKIDITNVDYISEEDYNKFFSFSKSSIRNIQKNDILFSIIGSIGNTFLCDDKKIGVSSSVAIIRPDLDKVNPNYLMYVLNSVSFQQTLLNVKGGSVQGYTNLPLLRSMQIVLPPLALQVSIANILLSLDFKIQNNELENVSFDELVKNIYTSWFNDFNYPNNTESVESNIPKDWNLTNVFNNVLEVKTKNKDNNDFPVLSVVKEGEFKLSDDVFTKQVYSKSTANYKIVRKNQVGYNPARANIGSIAMLKDQEVGLVSPIYTVFEMKDSITPTFFYYYMKQPIFLEMIKHHAIGTTRQNFPFEAFKMFDIVVPPMELQLEFEKIAEPIEKKIALLKEENKVLAEIRDTLLPKLMSGELPVEVGEE